MPANFLAEIAETRADSGLSNASEALPLKIAEWLNTDCPLSLAGLRGRIVMLHAFQMLYPGCVSHGLPQTLAIRSTFAEDDVVALGIHTVFERHGVMGPAAAF